MSDTPQWSPESAAAAQRELDPILERARKQVLARSDEERDARALAIENEPIDPDIALIGDYLSLDMTPEGLADVEDRLATDAEFRNKVAPLIWLWEQPVSWTAPSERETASGPTKPTVILDVVGPFIARLRGMGKILTIVVGLFLALVTLAVVKLHQMSVRSSQVTLESREGRASTSGILDPEVFTTNAADRQLVEPVPGIAIRLGPLSRLTRDRSAASMQDLLLALDGEAVIEISDPAIRIRLETPAAFITLSRGRYAVRGPAASTETRVAIDSGRVQVRTGASFTDGYLTVQTTGDARKQSDSTGFLTYHNIPR